jgi:RNA polymerase sigma-70 factor (ECF subfamily)
MDRDDRTDEELLLAVARGPGALDELYRRHVDRVLAFGARRFTSPEDVADFTADVFVQVLTSAARYDPARGSALAWLFGIAVNVARSTRRREARISRTAERWSGRELLDDDDTVRIEARIDAHADARRAWGRLVGLPERDRELLALVLVDGLAPNEAAAALGLRPGTARAILSRRRRELRTMLAVPRAAVHERT